MKATHAQHVREDKRNRVTSAYLGAPVHKQGHDDGEQAQADEYVLRVLHHRRQHHQVGVEGVQDGPVNVATLINRLARKGHENGGDLI